MILDKLFPHLRHGVSGDFLASKVLSWYGRTFIGGPKVDDVPGPDLSVRKWIVDGYFKIPVDRMPPKRNDHWEISQLWTAQLRDEEEKQVAKAVVIGTALLCSALIAIGVFVHGTTTGVEKWWAKHQAQAAAEEAAEYQANREALGKKWAMEFAAYSPQECIDESMKLRDRSSPQQRDRYSALESACQAKASDIEALAKTWSYDKCLDFGSDLLKASQGSSAVQPTWADEIAFQRGCLPTHGQKLSIAIQNLQK